MARRQEAPAPRPSVYHSLIDAERAALIQAGRQPTRHDLTQALIEATGLSPREARRAVAHFIDDRGGFVPSTTPATDARTGWIDDLLDAERVRANRDDQPVTPKLLIRAVRQAADLSPRAARAAVADYLHRRGGRTPRRGWGWLVALALLVAALAATLAWLWPRA